jgi:DNA polymerase V
MRWLDPCALPPYFNGMILGQPIPFETQTHRHVPMASASVQAGFPSPADDHLESSLDLNEHLVSNPAATFFVRVQGNSMKDAGIVDGDTLIVDRSVAPKDRQIVIAMLDGEFTVKRLRERGKRVFLQAENAEFAPIEISDNQELTIWGVVTFVIHRPR